MCERPRDARHSVSDPPGDRLAVKLLQWRRDNGSHQKVLRQEVIREEGRRQKARHGSQGRAENGGREGRREEVGQKGRRA